MDDVPARSRFLPQLGVVGRKLRTLFDGRIKAQGLTLSRARLLFHLAQQEGLTQKELAQLLAVEQPSMVTLLDAMEKNGFIRRVAIEGDRRAKGIFLTDAARDQTAKLMRITEDFNATVLAGINEEEFEVVTRVLQRVFDNINQAA